jgi:drug/metabolite transporter (DMT)-like permease
MIGFVVATKLTTAANAIFLVYTAPLYVALLSAWFLQEPIRRFDWLTILLALTGMACFCFERLSSEGWVGNLCALGSGMATAWLVLCLRKQHAAAPLTIMLLGNVLATLVGLPFMFDTMPDTVSWLALLLSGVVQLGVPSVLYCKAIPHVRAIEAVLIPIIEPVLNPFWVFLLLGEVPSLWALVGGGIVLGAVAARGLGMVWSTARDASSARYHRRPPPRH